MSQDYLAAFEALSAVYFNDAYSNIALNDAVASHKACRESFVRMMVKGTIRDTIRLDHIIDMLASGGIKSIKKRPLVILRMGLYAITSMDSVPDYAAVDEAVKLARKVSKGNDRFINAVLRSYIRKRDEIDSGMTSLSLRYAMPEDIAALLESQYGDQTEDVLRGLNTIPPVVIRVNTLRTDAEELRSMLSEEGFVAEILTGRALTVSGSGLLRSRLFREGFFSVQSLSSIKAIETLCPKKGSKVLDMCSSPGGKTCLMAEMMENDGEITACDIHDHRLELVRAQASRLGIDIIRTMKSDGTVRREDLTAKFDYVLADVPCSGLGVMASKPEIRLRTDVRNLEELESIQLSILNNAIAYARPGGLIEYSTCTLNKDENEGIINKFTKTCSLARVVEMHTILPYNNLAGFYYCILRKNA